MDACPLHRSQRCQLLHHLPIQRYRSCLCRSQPDSSSSSSAFSQHPCIRLVCRINLSRSPRVSNSILLRVDDDMHRFYSLEYGNAEEYCVYGELKVLPGASFKVPSPDCLDCKCTTQGLSCCGFGVSAGVAIPPEGCVAYNDGCSAIFVKDSNRSELCEPIKPALKRKRTRKPLTRRQ